MSRWKKMLGICMAGAMLITGGMLPQDNAATAAEGKDYGIRNPRVGNGVTTWDKVKFGSYYQDAEFEPEPIKWRVLSVDGDDAFLLADKNLDAKLYNEERTSVTWETCTLRKWLNEDFYNEAFDADEKKAIKETAVTNEDNPYYNIEGGNDTKDKVYLLSISEAGNAAYGFDSEYQESFRTRESKNTDYAKVNNAWTSISSNTAGNGYWWLRSPGGSSYNAASFGYAGYSSSYGDDVAYWNHAVRPALHINLSSSKVKDAGEVDSEGNITASGDGIRSPRNRDGVTTWDCVYFGNYRQNAKFSKQEIEWRVLSVDGDDAFLMADKNLNRKEYNEERTAVTWETCTLRKWLNGDFYNEAFDSEEKKAIKETAVVNEDNPYYDTEGGNDTKDKVYLLSISEAGNAAYGFDTEFREDSKTREAQNTDYAKVNNVRSSYYSNTAGNGTWWLRSPGRGSIGAAYVGYDGYGTYNGGNYVDDSDYAVRPALHINLSSTSWSKAGEVSAERQGDDNPTASPTPAPTQKPEETNDPGTTEEPTKQPEGTDKPGASPEPSKSPDGTKNPPTPVQTPSVTAPAPPPAQTQTPSESPALKKLKVSGVKCVKNTKKITGKVSAKNVSVRIKVGKKAYKKAAVKGKMFTLKLNDRLKKKTKVTVKVTKKGYETLVKSFKVK